MIFTFPPATDGAEDGSSMHDAVESTSTEMKLLLCSAVLLLKGTRHQNFIYDDLHTIHKDAAMRS